MCTVCMYTKDDNKPVESESEYRIDVENRICNFCTSSSIENESHFLLECSLYDKQRTILYDNLEKCSAIDIYNYDEAYHLLMGYLDGDTEIATIICNFCRHLSQS